MPQIQAEMDAQQLLEFLTDKIDLGRFANGIKPSEKQLWRWRREVSTKAGGQPNPIGKTDDLVSGFQKQQRQEEGLAIIAWLLIQFISRLLPANAGSANVLLQLEITFSQLRNQALIVLAEKEKNQKR